MYSCTCINDLSTCEPTTPFKIVKCTKECLDGKGSDIFQEDIINDLNFAHTKLQITNQKDVGLQTLVPVVVDSKEKEALNLEFIENKELKGDNGKKIKVGRFRKALKGVRNVLRKYF